MRALRILVIVMGVLLVGGTVALVVAIIARSGSRPAAPIASAVPPATAESTITFPAGGSILSVQPVGPHVVVEVGVVDGAAERRQLLVIDPASGGLRARIELRPE